MAKSKTLRLNNKADLEVLDQEIMDAMKKVCDNYNLTPIFKGGTFNPTGSDVKFRFEIRTNEKPQAEVESQKHLFDLYGISEYYNKSFKERSGRTFTITGYNPRCHAKPIMLTDSKGHGAKSSLEYVEFYLKLRPKEKLNTLTLTDVLPDSDGNATIPEITKVAMRNSIFARCGDSVKGDGMICPFCGARETYKDMNKPKDVSRWYFAIKAFYLDNISRCNHCMKDFKS